MTINTTRVSRRTLFGGIGAAALITGLSACGGDTQTPEAPGGTTSPTGAPPQEGGKTGGLLVIGAAVTASNQFARNFNRYGGGDTAPGSDLLWETLFRISSKDGGQILPVLAEKVEHTEDGKQATYTLRKDVTWSDGEPFTSKDVLYTLGTIYGTPVAPEDKAEDQFAWLTKPIEAPDDYTVIVNYHDDQRQQETNLALYYPMVPAHIYQVDGEA